jgi:hypothetical protein
VPEPETAPKPEPPPEPAAAKRRPPSVPLHAFEQHSDTDWWTKQLGSPLEAA